MQLTSGSGWNCLALKLIGDKTLRRMCREICFSSQLLSPPPYKNHNSRNTRIMPPPYHYLPCVAQMQSVHHFTAFFKLQAINNIPILTIIRILFLQKDFNQRLQTSPINFFRQKLWSWHRPRELKTSTPSHKPPLTWVLSGRFLGGDRKGKQPSRCKRKLVRRVAKGERINRVHAIRKEKHY